MLTNPEHKIIREWKDYVARVYLVFKRETQTNATRADFIYAMNSEIWWLRRQYPGVRDKLIIQRAYKHLLEAYKRSDEYSIKLNWKSFAHFCLSRRPSIAWAVLQARADQPMFIEKKEIKERVPIYTETTWCDHCKAYVHIVEGKYRCCNRRVRKK